MRLDSGTALLDLAAEGTEDRKGAEKRQSDNVVRLERARIENL